MELYFLRHAIAADEGPQGSGDEGRPLTAGGAEKMRAEAKGLRRLEVRPEALLASPLVRARQTAEIVSHALGLDVRIAEQLAPGCDLERLRGALDLAVTVERVMLVGHEPDFSTLVGELTGGRVELKKGGLARVDLSAIEPGAGTLVWLLPPRVLRELR